MKTLEIKRIVLGFLALCTTAFLITSCEQELVMDAGDVTQLYEGQNEQERYVFEGLKPLNDDALTERRRQDATYFERNEDALNDVLTKQPKFMTFNIQTSSKVVELELDKWDIVTDDFAIEDENGQILPFETTGVFYNGRVKGESNSSVAVSIFENELSVTIMHPEETHVVKQEDGLMTFYKAAKSDLNTPNLTCNHTDSDSNGIIIEANPENTITQRVGCTYDPIRVRYVIDYSFKKYFNHSNTQARNYLFARFNEAKSMYAYWNIPVYISRVAYLNTYGSRLQISSGTSNALGDMIGEFSSRFGNGSSGAWDINAAVVAVDATGGTSGTIVGGGYGVSDDGSACGNSAPICKKGAGLTASVGCRPINLTGLHEISGNPDDVYFTHVLAHEIGHNFGISHEYDNVTNDVMDHWAAFNTGSYPLHISHTTYVDMYYAWIDCYYNCD